MLFPEAITAANLIVAELKLLRQSVDGLNKSLLLVGETMSQEVQDLVAEVAAVKGIAASTLTFLQGLIAKLEAAKDDPAAIAQAVQDLKDAAQPLADAIAANP